MSPTRLIPDRSEALDTPSRGLSRPYTGAVLGRGRLKNVDISLRRPILGDEDQGRPDFCGLTSWAMNLDCDESARLYLGSGRFSTGRIKASGVVYGAAEPPD
jgi:hypothetical protein